MSDEGETAGGEDVLLDDDEEDDGDGVVLLSDEIEDESVGCFCDTVDCRGDDADEALACMLG